MNQQCKVCGEPAAGFHFGAFTCEGCKSFFGRSYNNLSSISDCKNGGECVINKKNRTACKACRLRKCLYVGMSKSGSRYGRRSNWFKIHCLLQEQQQQSQMSQRNPTPRTKEDSIMLGLEDYKNSTSPSISSPESHNSDSSVEVSERRAAFAAHPGFRTLHPHLPPADLSVLSKEMMGLPMGFHLGGMSLLPRTFMPPPGLTMFSPYHLYPTAPLVHSSTVLGTPPVHVNPDDCSNNDNNNMNNNSRTGSNNNEETCNKRFYLDAVLKSQRAAPSPLERSSPMSSRKSTESPANSPRTSPERDEPIPEQDNPIDLSMKTGSAKGTSDDEEDEEVDMEESDRDSPPLKRRAPMDLTTRA